MAASLWPKLRRVALLALWTSLTAHPALSQRTFDAEHRVLISLTSPDIFTPGVAHTFQKAPYAFRPLDFRKPFAHQALNAYRRRKLRLYQNLEFRREVPFDSLQAAIPALPMLMSKKYFRSSLDDTSFASLPDVRMEVGLVERWHYGEWAMLKSRETEAGFLLFQQGEGPQYVLFFQNNAPGVDWSLLERREDYGAVAEFSNYQVINQRLFCFRLADPANAEYNGWTQEINAFRMETSVPLPTDSRLSKRGCALQIPLTSGKVPSAPQMTAAEGLDSTLNRAVLQEAAAPLLRAVLTGKLKPYHRDGKQRMDVREIYRMVNSHPFVTTPADRRTARTGDYTHGLADLVVMGKLVREGSTARFVPELYAFSWLNPEEGEEARVQAFFRAKDVDRLKLKVAGKPLAQFLAQPSCFYFFTQVGDVFPQTHLESAWIGCQLLHGKWDNLPTEQELAQLSPEKWAEKLSSLSAGQ